MSYPVYRKYPNHKSFFKITSAEHFEEIKLTGALAEMHVFKANIHPDRLFIQDMIDMREGHWEQSSEQEFEQMKLKLG